MTQQSKLSYLLPPPVPPNSFAVNVILLFCRGPKIFLNKLPRRKNFFTSKEGPSPIECCVVDM